ncbi:16733_t:CDS:2 [Funneliformis geosporum]|uniref:5914_t:CDS:1 n=1 Tax=Funneliformis geosporum TaxID=1117311 RepID=A0A9W4SDD5_9GLOM|nr:16733_t:CDS:2 [Funneliformis geosporum]CAI2163097.1 5914_t:CDS:2 [Funneliformis geosporum]
MTHSRFYIRLFFSTCFALMVISTKFSNGVVITRINLRHEQKYLNVIKSNSIQNHQHLRRDLLASKTPKITNIPENNLIIPHTDKSIYKLDPTGSAVFYVAGIITSFANMLGSSLMIILTIHKYRCNSEYLTTSKRFPLYMAIMDFGTSFITLPNLFYPMTQDYLMRGSWCSSLGFMTSLLIGINMMLMAILALITYLRICKRFVVNLGKKDCFLFLSILIPTLTISFVTWLLDGFGPDTFWCFMNSLKSGSRVNLIALIAFAYIVTIITSFSYMNVIKRINNVEAMLASFSRTKDSNMQDTEQSSSTWSTKFKQTFFFTSASLKSSNRTSTISRETMSNLDGLELRPPSFFYELRPSVIVNAPTALQLIQYTPIIIYSLCFLVNEMQAWVYVLTVVMLNLGGVVKSVTFMKNELWCNDEMSEKREKSGGTVKASLNENDIEINSFNKNQDFTPISNN